jgi:hypothetical protein
MQIDQVLKWAGLILKAVSASLVLAWWYLGEDHDKRVRGRLDQMFGALDAVPVSEFVPRFLRGFERRWLQTFGGRIGLLRYAGLSFALNLMVLPLAGLQHGSGFIWPRDLGLVLLYATLGLIPDLLFGAISLKLLGRLHRSPTWVALVTFVAFDTWLLVVSIYANLILIFVLLDPAVSKELLSTASSEFLFLHGMLIVFLRDRTMRLLVPTASLQTCVYLLLGVTALLVRISPRWVKTITTGIAYRLAVFNLPVLVQLAAFSAGVAGLLAILPMAGSK